MNLTHPLRFSYWYDLIYHVLSCLPVDQRDASRLYDPTYIQWVNKYFPTAAIEQRTLPADLQVITTLYNQGEKSFHLHSFPLLFDSFEEFNSTIESTFDGISWQNPQQSLMAGDLAKNISLDLLELFRIALWSESNAGYAELHQQHIIPLYKEQLPELETEFSTIAAKIPGLADVRFMVSHPLRRSGRLLQGVGKPENNANKSSGPLIVIGLPDSSLEVPAWAPVIQGCHEYVLSKVLGIPTNDQSGSAHTGHTTRSGSAGYYYHMAPEIIALSIEARLFNSSEEYGTHFREWAARCLPASCSALASNLPWEIGSIPEKDGIDTLVDWLSSGGAVPESLREFHSSTIKQHFNLTQH